MTNYNTGHDYYQALYACLMYLMYYKPTWSQKLTCKGIRSLRSMVRSFQARSFPLIVRSFHNIIRTFPESLSYEQNKSITRTVNPCRPARCLIPSPDPRHKEAAIIILNISNTMRIFSNHTNRFVSQEGPVRETIKKDTHQIINICSWEDKSCHIGIPMQ